MMQAVHNNPPSGVNKVYSSVLTGVDAKHPSLQMREEGIYRLRFHHCFEFQRKVHLCFYMCSVNTIISVRLSAAEL